MCVFVCICVCLHTDELFASKRFKVMIACHGVFDAAALVRGTCCPEHANRNGNSQVEEGRSTMFLRRKE